MSTRHFCICSRAEDKAIMDIKNRLYYPPVREEELLAQFSWKEEVWISVQTDLRRENMKTILRLLQQDNLMWGGGKSSYVTFPETVCGKVHGQTKGIFYHKPCYYHCQHQHESMVDFPPSTI